MNIIGLGAAGCRIADCFSKYPQYNIYKVDVGLKGDNCYSVPKCITAEEYESLLNASPKLRHLRSGLVTILSAKFKEQSI